MKIRELAVPGAYEITPQQFPDDRGVFMEWYRFDKLESVVGHPLKLAQANTSVSRKGSLRGIHYADIPPGQAKYVTAMHGAVLDFVVDIREGSATFGQWDSVLLDDGDRRAVYISEGLGHCFLALTDNATVSYLVSETFSPGREHGITPLDSDIDLRFPLEPNQLLLSPKDRDAPSLQSLVGKNVLPQWDESLELSANLRTAMNGRKN